MSVNRDEAILSIRPQIKSIDHSKSLSQAESFQNKTLRPILKYQDEIIQLLFGTKSKAGDLSKLDSAEQRRRITELLERDTVFRNQCIGLVIGFMTTEELQIYTTLEAEMKRRIKTMLVERLISK